MGTGCRRFQWRRTPRYSRCQLRGPCTGAITVFLGNGAGAFSAPSTYWLGVTNDGVPEHIVLGDFNKDGHLDAVIDNAGGIQLLSAIYLGNGNGTFGTPTAIPGIVAGKFPANAMQAVDINGEGSLDIVSSSANGLPQFILGNGNGTFRNNTVYLTSGLGPDIVAGDFNHDGHVDIAGGDYGSDIVGVMLGNGTGGFNSPATYISDPGAPVSLVAGDFNMDGNLDLATANALGDNVSILLGNGMGGFNNVGSYPGGNLPEWITTADFNGDGFLDLAVFCQDGELTILKSNGNGTFSLNNTIQLDPDGFITTGDFNGDGLADLAVTNTLEGKLTILLDESAPAGVTPEPDGFLLIGLVTLVGRGSHPKIPDSVNLRVTDCQVGSYLESLNWGASDPTHHRTSTPSLRLPHTRLFPSCRHAFARDHLELLTNACRIPNRNPISAPCRCRS